MNGATKKLGDCLDRSLRPLTYDVILYKKCVVRPRAFLSNLGLISHIWNNVFAMEEIRVDLDSKRVGNEEGLSWMERTHSRLSRQDQEIARISKENTRISEENTRIRDALETQKQRWFLIRASEIEKNGQSRNWQAAQAREERNFTTHGGNILEDLEILEFIRTTRRNRFFSVRNAFDTWYGIHFDPYGDHIRNAPKLIIDVFNTFADTESLWDWEGGPTVSAKAREICANIIKKWTKYIDEGQREYPEEDIKKEYAKLAKLLH